MPKVVPELPQAAEQRITMAEPMQEQMPNLIPAAMENLMPNMLPLISHLALYGGVPEEWGDQRSMRTGET